MRRVALIAAVLVSSSPAVAAAPLVHATASCAPANKPGRVRCRAVIELPLDVVGKHKLSFAELRVTRADPGVTPLRARLGPLDAEQMDESRATFTFSVATEKVGEATMTVRLSAVVEGDGTPTPASHSLEVAVRVVP